MDNFDNNQNLNNEEVSDVTETVEIVGTEENAPKKTDWKKEVIDWTLSIVIAVVIALVLTTYVFRLVRVEGNSMQPTLQSGDFLYVHKLMYKPDIGDIIVIDAPDNPGTAYIKRIIALEGQTVQINPFEGTVRVDGEIIEEDYIDTALCEGSPIPYTVPKDHVYVLGDNRHLGGSKDSRSFGAVKKEKIMGKAMIRLFPFKTFGKLYK